MGKCDNCKKEILYNRYKRYRKQILCPECYATRLERKAEKKAAREMKADQFSLKKEIVKPPKKAKEAAEKQGLSLTILDDVSDDKKDS